MFSLKHNKIRVYVVVYSLQGIFVFPEIEEAHGKTGFHWGIFTMKKGSSMGTLYEVHLEAVGTNVPVTREWVFKSQRDVQISQAPEMLGLIMVGKVRPLKGVPTEPRVEDMMRELQLPNRDAAMPENCLTWTEAAVRKFQSRGWAEDFDFGIFMAWAQKRANEWQHGQGQERTISYVDRQFP